MVEFGDILRVMKNQKGIVFLFKMAPECDSTVCLNQKALIIVCKGVEYVFSCMKLADLPWFNYVNEEIIVS